MLQELHCVRIAGVGIEPLDKTLHHGAQITGGIGPVRVRRHLIGGAVKIKTAIVVRKTLAMVLIPDDGPLRKKIGGVGVAGAVGHWPRRKLSLRVESDRPASNGGFIDRGSDRKGLLSCNRGRTQNKCEPGHHELSSLCHIAPPESLRSVQWQRPPGPWGSTAHRAA